VPGKPREPDTPPDPDGPAGPSEVAPDAVRHSHPDSDPTVRQIGVAADELSLVLAALASVLGATAARVTVSGRAVAEWIDDGPEAGNRPTAVPAGEPGVVVNGRSDACRTIRRELLSRHVSDSAVELDFPGDTASLQPQPAAMEGLVVAASRILDCDAMEADLVIGTTQREHFLVALQHELRTPATALMLEAGLLQSGLLGNLPPRVQSTLERLERQVGDFLRVVQRVLDLAQVENLAEGRADLVDVRRAVLAVARNAEPEASRKGVAFSLFFPRRIPAIQTDEDRFRRVVNHLLANAVKYSGPGSVQIRVERGAGTGGAPALLVRIADCGPGIPAPELERVFEPFAQVEEGARTDSRRRGIGIGLSVARRLARSIGGEVMVESVVGTGTVATFSLPMGSARQG